MEYACRAEAVTARYYGETDELLRKYAWYLENSWERAWPVGSLKPNDYGLFDMHGNTWCWCQERKLPYPQVLGDQMINDEEDKLDLIISETRVLRGGGFFLQAPVVRSAQRSWCMPAVRFDRVGVRPARTIPLGRFTASLSAEGVSERAEPVRPPGDAHAEPPLPNDSDSR
jgi:formylglycine-generating enzyme required for sulfatase activity